MLKSCDALLTLVESPWPMLRRGARLLNRCLKIRGLERGNLDPTWSLEKTGWRAHAESLDVAHAVRVRQDSVVQSTNNQF